MPRSGTFRYRFDAGLDRSAAVTLLSEFSRHAELHPLIVAVREVTPPPGTVRRYRISDRIPVGPFAVPITYVADVLSVTGERIVTVARQRPSTTLHNDTRLSEMEGRLRAEVEITMTAPGPLLRFALRQAREAHTELAVRLSALLCSPPESLA